MDVNDLILKLINEKYKSIRQFAIAAGIPYSTVKSGLKAGVSGMAVENVIKMCGALNVALDSIMPSEHAADPQSNLLSADEFYMLEKYRALPEQVRQEVLHYLEYRLHSERPGTGA